MPTTLNSGLQLPDKGSVDWYGSMQTNYNLLDTHLGNTDTHVTAEDKANWNSKQGSLSQAQLDAIAQVATNTSDIATLQSGKANASHTHSSSDITDIGDYATKTYVDNSISGLVDSAPAALDTLKELSTALGDDANFASTVTNALATKANSSDLATVATSGSYSDLNNKPTINDSTITIQKNGSLVGTFTVNGSAKTINIPVPTKTSDLTNDSNFVDISNSAVASGITSAKVTSYDSHIADTDIHVTTADKSKWNNGVSQSYVLRYSSSSVTNNSTIAYSTLDNTDNIKSGDKVIDVNGKIFSVVSVDTANQTVTVGSALIDLALDANVMHTSGNETVGGIKTFSDDTFVKSLNFTNEVPSQSSSSSSILPIITTITYGDSSPSVQARLNLRITADGVKSLYPHENNQYSLGLTSRRWTDFFSYHGNFAGQQQGDEYSGNARTNLTLLANRDSVGQSGCVVDTFRENTTQGTGMHILGFGMKENSVRYEGCRFSWVYNDDNNGYVFSLRPTLQGANQAVKHNLGTSVDKWDTINGLEPSALSMPDLSNGVDISSYITTGNTDSSYTPSVNGWIWIRLIGYGASIIQGDFGINANYVTNNLTNEKWVETNLFVTKDVQATIKCRGITGIISAKFYPCQGNV